MKKLVIISLFFWACNQAPVEESETIVQPSVEEKAPDVGSFIEKGTSIAQQSQQALGGKLKAALSRGGVAEAIQFCNLNAIPLTDSLAQHFDVIIYRLTDRPRNQMNAFSPTDAEVFGTMQSAIAQGYEATPISRASGDGAAVYVPIQMQPFCLTCHGKEKEGLLPEAASLIAEIYPQDKATGYSTGDLRGMWRINFIGKPTN
jgi:hypothetical protein